MSCCPTRKPGGDTVPLQKLITVVGAPAGVGTVDAYVAQPTECWLKLEKSDFQQLKIVARVFGSSLDDDRYLRVYSSFSEDQVFDDDGVPGDAEELLELKISEGQTVAVKTENSYSPDSEKLGKYLFWVIDLQQLDDVEEYACFEIDVIVS